jgi:transcriptional regulator GlxA family with amidase domain
MSPADLSWLKAVEAQVLSGIRNPDFSVVQLAQKLHLSERQLHRRIKSITGMTPNRYVWELRLHQARQMLESGSKRTVAEVSYAVGVDPPEYFSKKYKERFGKKPVDYLNN